LSLLNLSATRSVHLIGIVLSDGGHSGLTIAAPTECPREFVPFPRTRQVLKSRLMAYFSTAYGRRFSDPGRISPGRNSMPASARAVKVPRLNPKTQTESPVHQCCIRHRYACATWAFILLTTARMNSSEAVRQMADCALAGASVPTPGSQ